MATSKKQAPLLPVYLIVGEDELKRETVIKRLRERLGKMGDLSFNSETFSGETCSGEQVVTAANTLPFASEVRLVEVHDVDKMKKADTELLVSYLKEPCQTTVLALLGTKLAKNTRLYKAVSAVGITAIIDCAPFARRDLSGAVRSMAVGHGIALTQGAAAALIDLVGTNTVALDGELKKLSLSHRGIDPVNENEVLAMVARTAEVKPWDFVDAFSRRNATRCIYLMNRLTGTSPFALLAMCTTRIRELITVKALTRRGEQGRIATVLKMPDWRLKNHRAFAQAFSMEELVAALRSARDAEQAMKSGSDQSQEFIAWMLGVCKKS